jgi:hypothetical protein
MARKEYLAILSDGITATKMNRTMQAMVTPRSYFLREISMRMFWGDLPITPAFIPNRLGEIGRAHV